MTQVRGIGNLLICTWFLLWTGSGLAQTAERPDLPSSDRVNLALRHTADGLLRQAGDSTSRIPVIEHPSDGVWQILVDQSFRYEDLPALLQASLDIQGIDQAYNVAVRRCEDQTIDLGYHQVDFLDDSLVACQGREFSQECHVIEVAFLQSDPVPAERKRVSWLFWLIAGGLLGYGFFRWRKRSTPPADPTNELAFGQCRLDVAGLSLTVGGQRLSLTFREAKLLHLFASHPDTVLEREDILQQVWADEGVLVGRSLDMFVSRLRKKLAGDDTVSIVAVHGIGYRLETGRS